MSARRRGKSPTPATTAKTPRDSYLLLAAVIVAAAGVPLALDPLSFNPFGPAKLLALSLAVALAAAALVARPRTLLVAVSRVRSSQAAWAFGAYGAIAVLSTLTSVDRARSVFGSFPEYQGLLALLCWGLLFFAILGAEDDGRAHRVFARSLCVGLLIVSSYAIAQALGLDVMTHRATLDVTRARSTLGNSSNLGVYLLLALPFALERMRAEAVRAWRATAIVAGAVGAVVLVMTLSRGAWLGALAALAVLAAFALARASRGVQVRVAAVAAAVVAVSLVVTMFVPAVQQRVDSASPTRGTGRWRLVAWETGLHMAADRPLLGWGPNSFRFVYPSYRTEKAWDVPFSIGEVADAHNVLVNTAASFGFPALAALLGWFGLTGYAVAKRSLRGNSAEDRAAAEAAAMAIVGAAVALMFHFPTLDTGTVLAVVLALALARESAAPPRVAPAAPALRVAGGLALALAVVVASLSVGLVAATEQLRQGLAIAASSAPWSLAEDTLDRATALAPWEPVMRWSIGKAAADHIKRGYDAQAFTGGMAALKATERAIPMETSVIGDEGNLLLVSAVQKKDSSMLQQALERFEAASDRDPNNASYWMGRGSAYATGGDFASAIPAFERAAQLAPTSSAIWGELARAYDAAGRAEDAKRARHQRKLAHER